MNLDLMNTLKTKSHHVIMTEEFQGRKWALFLNNMDCQIACETGNAIKIEVQV